MASTPAPAPSPEPAPSPGQASTSSHNYNNISIKSLNCDKCAIHTTSSACPTTGNCTWIPDNTSSGGKCVDKCNARITKGECEQYHIWNNTTISPVIYAFDGNDNRCNWHPHAHSIDDTPDSKEGECRAKQSTCFEECPAGSTNNSSCNGGVCRILKDENNIDKPYCIPNNLTSLGNIYCGNLYNGHHKNCNIQSPTNCGVGCEKYQDPRVHDLPPGTSAQNKGICVSDGKETYDLTTGESKGLMMTDRQCNAIKDSMGCMNYRGMGCLWEPYNEYCIPSIDTSSESNLLNSCKPIEGHVPPDYDINMIEEEHINVSEYRDRNNKKYPYLTSKYLCDVCHLRDTDLDNMKEMSNDPTRHEELKYYMIKKFVDFGGVSNRSTTVSMTPKEYCERPIDDTHDKFNPCSWVTSNNTKGGSCVSKCSKHSPVDNTVTNSQELKIHRDKCISEKWFPESSVRGISFPNLVKGSESTEDYFDNRYCTWDGFECHNSIPCKFAQQTRCEDLGYEWYEGSALDIMNQAGNDSSELGIPIDLSTSYPIVRKGDGKPVEGDMEGICVYPNIEAGFISQPADYIIKPEFIGEQVIMMKWREYGTGWWEDLSLCRKKPDAFFTDKLINNHVKGAESKKSYFLGENVALIPFRISQGDKCSDVKTAINSALQNYQYFVYNGEWVMYAEDLIHAIDRSYPSTVPTADSSHTSSLIGKYRKYYGYLYYSSDKNDIDLSDDGGSSPQLSGKCDEATRKHLNAIYDLRGTINILPVLDQHCALEISSFVINSQTGNMDLTVSTHDQNIDPNRFQFVEFMGTELFKVTGSTQDQVKEKLKPKLQLTVLSKYKYDNSSTQPDMLPKNIVQGYGTLYENLFVEDIEKPFTVASTTAVASPAPAPAPTSTTTTTTAITPSPSPSPSPAPAPGSAPPPTPIPPPIRQPPANLSSIMRNNIIPTSVGGTPGTPIDYDLRKTSAGAGINELKEIINLFREDKNGYYSYSNEELNNWALFKEYKNLNLFSQPIISYKDELYKASCKQSNLKILPNGTCPANGAIRKGLRRLCSGSLESWKILNENSVGSGQTLSNPVPKYQTLDLKIVNGLLKMMSRYVGDTPKSISPEVSTYLNISSISKYRNGFQQSDIKKSILWSITRSTPAFWGNLSFNRGHLNGSNNPLYSGGAHFNKLLDNGGSIKSIYTGNPLDGFGAFDYKINKNCLIRPFCEVGGASSTDDVGQNILWKNIMQYTGGNKREIQLARNVPTENYIAYIDHADKISIPSDINKRNYYHSTGGQGSGSGRKHYMPISYDKLKAYVDSLTPILSLSKREYLFRALLDWKKLDTKTAAEAAGIPSSTINRAPPHGCGTKSTLDTLDIKYNLLTGNSTAAGAANGKKLSTVISHIASNWEATSKAIINAPEGWRVTKRQSCNIPNDHHAQAFLTGGNGVHGRKAPAGGVVQSRKNIPYGPIAYPHDCKKGMGHRCGAWMKDAMSADGNIHIRGKQNGQPAVAAGYYYGWDRQRMEDWTGDYCADKKHAWGNGFRDHFAKLSYVCDINGRDCTTSVNKSKHRKAGEALYKLSTCCAVDRYLDCSLNTVSKDNTLPIYTNDTKHLFPDLKTTSVQSTAAQITTNLSKDDLKPQEFNKNVAAIYRLTHLPPPSTVYTSSSGFQNDSTSKNIFKTWGAGTTPIAENDSAMWTALNGEFSLHKTMMNNLIYPLDNAPIQSAPSSKSNDRNDNDKLRAWCLSNSASLDNNFIKNTIDGGNRNTYIDPDNKENQMGILYNEWLNNRNTYSSSIYDINSEYFNRKKEINAYKYPQVCEPWLLKSSDTGLAQYTNDIIDWNGYGNQYLDPTTIPTNVSFVPFITANVYTPSTIPSTIKGLPDVSMLKDSALNNSANSTSTGYPWTVETHTLQLPPPLNLSISGKGITDNKITKTFGTLTPNNITPLTNKYTIGPTGFDNNIISGIQRNDLVGDNVNNFYNMLHPLSITAAKPREKIIYVNITPNNDMFNTNSDKINIYYFEGVIADPPGALTTNTSLTLQDAQNSVINRYDLSDAEQKPYFWLHPGIGSSSKDTELWNAVNAPKIGSNALIVGKNANTTLSTGTSGTTGSAQITTDLISRANFHVSYFKHLHDLLGSSLIKTPLSSSNSTPKSYKFANALIPTRMKAFGSKTLNTTNVPTNMNPSTSTFIKDIFYRSPNGISNSSTNRNKLLFGLPQGKDYYNSHLPPRATSTKPIDNSLFGTGYMSNGLKRLPDISGFTYTTTATPSANAIPSSLYQAGSASNAPGTINLYKYKTGTSDFSPTLPPSMKYFNINMVFPTARTSEQTAAINTCKDLIKSKLSVCGNYNNWSSPNKTGCISCFDIGNSTSQGLCSRYPEYVSGLLGNVNTPPPDDATPADLGVCGILEQGRSGDKPWAFFDVTHQPEDFGTHLPTVSPYNTTSRTCNKLISDTTVTTFTNTHNPIEFIPIQHAGSSNTAGTGVIENVAFFKPARSSSSDVFEDGHNNLSETPFGCMRKDLSLMKASDYSLSCNTNLSTPVEREKHSLINFIVAHTNDLNASQRTKLAIMSEEELLNKALSLGISLVDINNYTKPQLHTKIRDTLLPNLCEDGKTACTTDANCPGHYKCGLYEQWNDLQKYYYNISDSTLKTDFTTRKEWEYVGCGIDLNYSDNTSGESVCKDKYPGLCEKNVEKCNSKNLALKRAIMLDCPETCQVQYTDFDRFKDDQVGALSICTSRGRCKWSHDQDPSNLLPPCEEHTTRELGSTTKCRNYNSMTDGPEAGSCNLKTHPETLNSPVCAEQRCTSMQGCKFTAQSARFCRVPSSVNANIIRETDCPKGGRWIGASTGGQCIIDEQDLYDSDLQNFEEDCRILGGTIVQGSNQSCQYHPDIPYTGEDPCSHTVDLDDLTEDEKLKYFYPSKKNDIHVSRIVPETLQGGGNSDPSHPDYIKIILDKRLNDTTINNFNQMVGMNSASGNIYPKSKYLYIDNNTTNIGSLCSQYLLGKSKIVQIKNIGPGEVTEHTEIIIGGPHKAYILPRDVATGDIDIGGPTSCQFMGIYDLENYYTNSPTDGNTLVASTPAPAPPVSSTLSDKKRAEACYHNVRGACNYENSSKNCVSCALYKDEQSCFGNNDPEEYSRCGWGSIKDMCEVIGEVDECKKMHLDGCEWNPATQKCSLNKLTDDDGNPLVDKVGCVKCDDIKHKNTCNSMKNCFWDRITNTDGDNIGECRACSSIGDPNGDGIKVNAPWSPTNGGTDSKSNKFRKIDACDDFQLTEGQCEFRNPSNKVTGLDSDFDLFSPGFINYSNLSTQWKDLSNAVWNSITGDDDDINNIYTNECNPDEDKDNKCKCSPTRLYPFFPDWILHNLFFLVVFAPFMIYFMYAWYNVLVSPSTFAGLEDITKGDDDGGGDKKSFGDFISNTVKKFKEGKMEQRQGSIASLSEFAKEGKEKIKKELQQLGGSNKIGTRYNIKGMKEEFNPLEEMYNLLKSKPDFILKIKGVLKKIKFNGFFPSISDCFTAPDFTWNELAKRRISPIFTENVGGAKVLIEKLFHSLTPQTNENDKFWSAPVRDLRNLNGIKDYLHLLLYVPTFLIRPAMFFKLLFIIVSLPFTILQLLTKTFRLSLPTMIPWCLTTGSIKLFDILSKSGPLGTFAGVIIVVVAYLLALAAFPAMFIGLIYAGIAVLKKLSEFGINPNHNYVDPVEGVPHKVKTKDGKIVNLPAAGVWPRTLYREEWDDMIKDPISDAVVQQRESLLPEILQGDVNDEDNVSDAYEMAYLETKPEDLNWSKYIRKAGKLYNNFVNRLSDNFILSWIILPVILFRYISTIGRYFPSNSSESFDLKSFITYTVIYSVVVGILTVLFTKRKVKDNEYDGAEKKCYGDIPLPFKAGNETINYPKLCIGDSVDDEKNECPYGCYYIGEGEFLPNPVSSPSPSGAPQPAGPRRRNPDYGKKCKDNRSVLALGGILDPEPTLNMPFYFPPGKDIPSDWNMVTPKENNVPKPGKRYVCPPTSRFMGKYPYDALCSTTAKRCKATKDTKYNIPNADDYCEILYRKNDYNDTKCNSGFSSPGDDYSSTKANDSSKRWNGASSSDPATAAKNSAKGELIGNGKVLCEIHTPYDGYKEGDTFCPFPLPAAQNSFFSEKGDTRDSVSLWNWAYDKIRYPSNEEMCGKQCADNSNCTQSEMDQIEICKGITMGRDSSDNKTKCEGHAFPDGTTCTYFPEKVPLQTSIQNQERYLIVNQNYGENLFS